MHLRYFVGVDFGQTHDHTAIAVVQRIERPGDWDPEIRAVRKLAELRLLYLERIELGTPYPKVVERIAELVEQPELHPEVDLVVDATGVGRPIVDLLDAKVGCKVLPVVVTGGAVQSESGGYHHVPKIDLIMGLKLALQEKYVKIPSDLPLCETLLKELGDMRVRITHAGNEQFGAWREGQHDDLVFAVAVGCWGARHKCPTAYGDIGHWNQKEEIDRFATALWHRQLDIERGLRPAREVPSYITKKSKVQFGWQQHPLPGFFS